MKLGLCLGGGGAKGAYQIGAAKALQDLGLLSQVEAFSGTSIGAVNACLLASMSPDEAALLWFSISNDMLKRTEGVFKRIIKEKLEFKKTGLFEIGELERMLKQHLPLDKLREQTVFVTLSEGGGINEGIFGLFKSGFHHYLKRDQSNVVYSKVSDTMDDDTVYKQILASCSIPIIFAPTELDEHQYYDGAVYDNSPVRPLVDEGCDTIIVIHLEKIHFLNQSKFPGVKILELQSRHHLGGMLNFDAEKSKKIWQYGYDDMIEFIRNNPLK